MLTADDLSLDRWFVWKNHENETLKRLSAKSPPVPLPDYSNGSWVVLFHKTILLLEIIVSYYWYFVVLRITWQSIDL